MNSILERQYPIFRLYQQLRAQLLAILTDDDLMFTPGGENRPLGELCREIGETQTSYIHSFQTFRQDFDYRNETPGLATSVTALQAWYEELDQALETAVAALTDETIRDRRIDRGPNFQIPAGIQLEIYKEALLIFYGKVSVYLKAMGKERPEQWVEWIA